LLLPDDAQNEPEPAAAFGVQPFALLQQRIGRKNLTGKVLAEAPVAVLAYDLVEWQGEDWRQRPHRQRRRQLEAVLHQCDHPTLMASPLIEGEDWKSLARL